MAAPETREPSSEISLRHVARVLLASRRWIILGMILGGGLAGGLALTRIRVFRSTMTVVGVDPGGAEARFAGLAGQLGLGDLASVSRGGSLSPTPDLIGQMATSDVILLRVLEHNVPDPGGATSVRLRDLLVHSATTGPGEKRVRNAALRRLRGMVNVRKNRLTNSATLAFTSPWPEVSKVGVEAVVSHLNSLFLELRRAQAEEERRFSQNRIAERQRELRAAEDKVATFLSSNRAFETSPELKFEYERLQRQVDFQSSVLTALLQSYEDAGVRAIRDTPLLIAIEPAMVPFRPQPRNVAAIGLMGVMTGGLAAVLLVLSRSRSGGA